MERGSSRKNSITTYNKIKMRYDAEEAKIKK
jgi:hypothetical protein